jgi:hypothetical protein
MGGADPEDIQPPRSDPITRGAQHTSLALTGPFENDRTVFTDTSLLPE